MKNKKKVCFFVTTLESGGLENYLLRFIKYKANEFDEIVVYCKGGITGELALQYDSIPNVSLIKHKIRHANFSDHYQLLQFYNKHNFDVVCDFTGNFAAPPLLVAKIAGVENRVVFFRKDTNIFKETKFNLFYNNLLNKLLPFVSTHILSNSISAFNFFFNNKWKNNLKYKVIYNGINASQFLNTKEHLRNELKIPKSAFVVGHVGRYNEAKNHKTIIEVAINICKNNPNIYFVLCGKDTDVYLSNRVFSEGLEGQIKLLGLRNDVVKVLNTLDCFYFPSFSEGQPNALIEAMIAGLPIVASNIEPIKESVPDSFVSELVEAESVEEAMNKILKVYKNIDVQRFGQWAIDKYDYQKLFEEFYMVLNSKENK